MKKNKHTFNKGSKFTFSFHKKLKSAFSNMRFSLTFRIALHYAAQLLKSTLFYIFLFIVLFSFIQIPEITQTIERISAILPTEVEYNIPQETGEAGVDVYLSAHTFSNNQNRIREYIEIAFTKDLFTFTSPVLRIPVEQSNTHQEGTWIFSFSLSSRIQMCIMLVGILVLFDIMRALRFIKKRNSLSKSVLKPIRDMTDMAATLSANNLSNRINIAGTKNELKDLAVVINTMLDRIERSYNSQKQFVSDASHELRTPIAVIQGYISMLNRWGKADKEVLDEGLSAIAQETESMKDLVENLLFLARHDKRTLLLETEDFDPCEIMAAVHREAKLVSSQYEFTLMPLEHCVIRADKNMIKQVVRVLCDNAIKYTAEGGRITLGVKSSANGCALIISDTGSGISQADLPKIFDRFYRADDARKTQSSGHGLGLSIARIITLAHSGKMSVRSKEGVGTTFKIYLPRNFQSKTETSNEA